jgi:hypothetical protein
MNTELDDVAGLLTARELAREPSRSRKGGKRKHGDLGDSLEIIGTLVSWVTMLIIGCVGIAFIGMWFLVIKPIYNYLSRNKIRRNTDDHQSSD